MSRWDNIIAAVEHGQRLLGGIPCGYERSVIGSMMSHWLYENGDIGVFVTKKPTPGEMDKLVSQSELLSELRSKIA